MRIDIFIAILLVPILLLVLKRLRLKKLVELNSKLLGKIEVFEKFNKEKVLTINSYPQGVSIEKDSIKKSYWYKIADETVLHSKKIKNPKILMLGLGANTISGLINKLDPNISQTIVEFDPMIIKACQEYFQLKDIKNLNLLNKDAYKLVKDKSFLKNKFDVVIVDIFTGNPPYIDLKSNKPNFIQQLLPLLKKKGTIIFNRPAHTKEARNDGFILKEYLESLFKNVNIFDIQDPRGFRNHVITASIKIP